MTDAYRLTKTGRAGLKALLDADQLDHTTLAAMNAGGYRAPGWNAVVDLPDDWTEPVKPPLPPEPGPGLYLMEWEHNGARHKALVEHAARGLWESPGWVARPWVDVCEVPGSTFTRLVPAPDPDDDKPSAEDWTEGRKAARVHGFAGGTEVNSVSFAAGFGVGFRKARRLARRFAVPEPVTLPPNIHDVVAAAIARAEEEPVSTGHYALAERVVEELRVRGWLSAADQAEGTDRG